MLRLVNITFKIYGMTRQGNQPKSIDSKVDVYAPINTQQRQYIKDLLLIHRCNVAKNN